MLPSFSANASLPPCSHATRTSPQPLPPAPSLSLLQVQVDPSRRGADSGVYADASREAEGRLQRNEFFRDCLASKELRVTVGAQVGVDLCVKRVWEGKGGRGEEGPPRSCESRPGRWVWTEV